jgi:hypothetical protein
MTNRITLLAKLLDAPKVRSRESRNGTVETISLWIEVSDGERKDRFTVDVACPKASTVAGALPKGALVEATGAPSRPLERQGHWPLGRQGLHLGGARAGNDPLQGHGAR